MSKKDEKSIVVKEPNALQRRIVEPVRRYINETIGELRKVTWPTRKEATNLTAIVLAVTFSMGIFLGLLDYLFSQFFALLFS